MRSEVLRVRGMTCMHCKANVEQMLLKLDGVEEADVNLERAEVRVIFDDEVVQLEEIKEEIEDIGYDVEE
ncbi:MAG: heavy-metal-associated domain-containing protein [Syntrophomonadaceae bacterium]|nr:heavy-metal-associated domain-containing protein [Syntrophomonadaceae bacterium]